MKKTRLLTILVVIAVWLWGGPQPEPASSTVTQLQVMTIAEADALDHFEAELEELRQQMRIPAFSAAIVKDQKLIWSQGFGYADLGKKVEATASTPYHLASLTKPVAAAILMQLVEEGRLSLDDPVAQYGIQIESPGVVRVRHLLTHTSHGRPGADYMYRGDRFGLLTPVMEQVSGRPFREMVQERILEPLQMANSATNPWGSEGFLGSLGFVLRDGDTRRVYDELAEPYRLNESYEPVHGGGYMEGFNAAAGLISTVEDMAKFDIAMDRDLLVSAETKAQMFAPTISTTGEELPYGQGWFVQEYAGTRLLWHYGLWYCDSSLILKAPDEGLTFIVLANSPELSRPYKLGHKDTHVLNSPLALAFYEAFVFQPQYSKPMPEIDWEGGEAEVVRQLSRHTDPALRDMLEWELWSHRMLFGGTGRVEQADRLLDVHAQAFADSPLRRDPTLRAIITEVPEAVPTPGLRHVLIASVCALVFLSMLLLWPAGYLASRLRLQKSGAGRKKRDHRKLCLAACIMAALAALLFLSIFTLAVIHYNGSPAPPIWVGGGLLVKALLALPRLYLLLIAGLVLLGILAWRARAGSLGWRLHYTLITMTALICIYLWHQLALLA
jgi:CubicO group peptidase (beta-lactamase class C family)